MRSEFTQGFSRLKREEPQEVLKHPEALEIPTIVGLGLRELLSSYCFIKLQLTLSPLLERVAT